MRAVLIVSILGCFSFAPLALVNAQVTHPVTPLTLAGEPRPTQIPAYSTLATPQCDSSGEIYLRYAAMMDNSTSTLAALDSDGTTRTIALATPTSSANDAHVFLFAVGSDGTLHEIVRVPDDSDQGESSSDVVYASFDTDGSLRSQSGFAQEFIPSMLLPLPDGDFFASGVTLSEEHGEISETPIVGIFDSDARLLGHLKKDPVLLKRISDDSSGDDADNSDTAFDGGVSKLGSDGNIYVLLPGEHARVAVVTPGGRIFREMKLQEPFDTGVAHDMWISGNRILIVFEGEADDPKDAYVYALYDAQSGELIRLYHPEFSGTVACFEDGQTLSVLVQQSSSGKISLGTADLQ